jgi:hypothetical protein
MSVACAVLTALHAGCGRCTEDWPLHYTEALLPGYSQLECEFYDYDSTVIAFSYSLPKGTSGEEALTLLESSVNRSMWRMGSTPPETCYRVVTKTKTYLLMTCVSPGTGSTSAWEFLVEGGRLRATTGPASHVLDFALQKE